MKRPAMRTALGLLAALVLSPAANAQLFRAYLSSAGSDANPCTLAAPCRLLPAALAAVSHHGEIWMLDSANFNTGPVDVTKSVTILAVPGQVGSVVAQNSSPAILIATADVRVKLRNLMIVSNVNSPGTDGIRMTAGAALTVEGCLIADMQSRGIHVGTDAKVAVSNSVIRGVSHGVAAGGGASLEVANVKFSEIGSFAVYAEGSAAGTTTRISVSDSHFTRSHIAVFARATTATSKVRVAVSRSSVTMGDYGVASQSDVAGGEAVASVADSLLAGLAIHAFFQFGSGAVTESFGNNTVRNNASNVSGTLTPVASM